MNQMILSYPLHIMLICIIFFVNILIKQGREEPNPAEAAAVGMEISSEQDPDMLEKWNTAIHDLVTKLPGVTTKNQHSLLIKGKSLDHLSSLSKVINTTGNARIT
jgi:hypothetical protein